MRFDTPEPGYAFLKVYSLNGELVFQDDDFVSSGTYDFDVVVDPQWQGYQRVGFQLINAALEHAQQSDAALVRAYVVNTRLIGVLKSKYGFDGSSGREDRPDILYKWL